MAERPYKGYVLFMQNALNPIELVWAYIKRHHLANFCPETLEELKAYLGKVWPKVRYCQLPAKLLGLDLEATQT